MTTQVQDQCAAVIDQGTELVAVRLAEPPPTDVCPQIAEIMRAAERWAQQELRECALALHRLAYSQPYGVGERALLRLAAQMNTAAGTGLDAVWAALGLSDAPT